MGGGCTCQSDINKYLFGSSDFILHSEGNKKNILNKNENLIPEQNIKIIPREDFENIDNIKSNNPQSSDKTKMQNNKNNLPNLSHKERHSIANNLEINKRKFQFNKKDNSSFLISSGSKKNNLENNNNQVENSLNRHSSKHKLFDDNFKKTDTNFNYNLGEKNFIFINISRGGSLMNNDAENNESNTPKMLIEKDNIEEMVKGTKRKFSQFCKKIANDANGKLVKSRSNVNNIIINKQEKIFFNIQSYMDNYSNEMLNAINSIRKKPEAFIQYIDELIKNNIQKINDDMYIVSKNIDEKIKFTEDFLSIFEKLKTILKDIINSKNLSEIEEFKYNKELEINLEKYEEKEKEKIIKESNIDSSMYYDKYNTHIVQYNNNYQTNKKKKNDSNTTLDLSDDKIANLILEKRKQIKSKYPKNVFKMSVIKDIKINILIQLSMEIFYNQFQEETMLNDILFNPIYREFAVSWTYEINRKFISISCFA